MLPTVGYVAIALALAASIFAAAAFVIGGRSSDPRLLATARNAVYATFILSLVASYAMVLLLVTHDFSVAYVARNNSTTTPVFYSIISLWAALEGSILFWGLILTGLSALVVYRYRARHPVLMPWVGATLSLIAVFFFVVMVIPSNPFERMTPVPSEGPGPNALLQNHPLMGLHPPLLYLGYVGLSVPFAFAMAALVTRRTDEAWLAVVRRWTMVPWTFLTLGLIAGGWWGYEVLGWGGYWAWDPVENAALLPWLTATAFIHSSMVAERRQALKVWTLALIIATFELTLLGTFLTRSGVIFSVHSFTQSATGPFFLAAIAISMAAALSLLVWRLPDLRDEGRIESMLSRESAFLFNNVLLLAFTFTVLFGSLFPLVVEATGGGKVSVGAPWFNQVSVPIAAALLFLMGVGPALPWGTASWMTLRERFVLPLFAGTLVAGLAWALGLRAPYALLVVGLAVFVTVIMGRELFLGARARARTHGVWLGLAAWELATRNRRRYGGYAIHVGVLVVAVAIALNKGLLSETTVSLGAGEDVTFGGYTIAYEALDLGRLADNPSVTEARARLSFDGPSTGTLGPALRDYPNSRQAIATPAVHTTLTHDLYATLMAYEAEADQVTLRIFVNPGVVWIWIGGGMIAAGALFAMWPDQARERRFAVPTAAGAGIGRLDAESPRTTAMTEPLGD
jgi:cytochrome c-type biogenesis protein CcmF